jgi:monofunctional chorismate mutase
MLSLIDLRKQISNIDDEIRKLFLMRLEISKKIGEYKKDNNLPIYDPKREQQLMKHQRQMINNDALWIYFEPFYQVMLDLSKEVQK